MVSHRPARVPSGQRGGIPVGVTPTGLESGQRHTDRN
jgi:hypothetical protein